MIDKGKLLWEKLPYMSVALRVPMCMHTQTVSFPELGQILNKLPEEKGFVRQQGRQRKKTIAEG